MSVTIMLITVTTIPMTLTVIPVINYVPFIIFPICITSVNTGSSQNVKHFGERRTATRFGNTHTSNITYIFDFANIFWVILHKTFVLNLLPSVSLQYSHGEPPS